MKKKAIALLLILALTFSLLAACGEKDTKTIETEESTEEIPEFAKGCYAVLDENEDTVAYLRSTGKKLTVYDADGSELMAQAKFSWDEEEEAFVIDETAAFTLEISKKTTAFSVPKKSPTGLDKGDYTLEEIGEEDIPAPAAEQEPKSEELPAAEPEADPVTVSVPLPSGCYEVCHSGEHYGYFEFDGTSYTVYEEDGTVSETGEMIYNESNGTYTDSSNAILRFEKTDTGYLVTSVGVEITIQFTPIDSIPAAETPTTGIPLPEGYYSISLLGYDIGYFGFDGTRLTLYDDKGNTTNSNVVIFDVDTGIYMDEAYEVFYFKQSDEGYLLYEQDLPDGPALLTPVDALPDPENSGAGANSGFYPSVPANSEISIPIARFQNTEISCCFPDIFISAWDQMEYTENGDTVKFNIIAGTESGSGAVAMTLMVGDTAGYDPDTLVSYVAEYYDVNEDGTIYDTVIENGEVPKIDLAGTIGVYRWHDTLIDGIYTPVLLLVVDNGDVFAIALFSGRFTSEKEYNVCCDYLSTVADSIRFTPIQ